MAKMKSSMSTVNMSVTAQIRSKIEQDVRHPQNETLPMYFHYLPKYTITLFDFKSFPEEFSCNLRKETIEMLMMLDLEDSGALNWVEPLKRLYPLKTKGDGNCLLHGASLGMWGVHDSNAFLRRLVHITLVSDGLDCDHHRFRSRWRYTREHEIKTVASRIEGGLQYTSRDWDLEWAEVIQCASDVNIQNTSEQPHFDFLEDIHVFVLANVLRRPIFILSSSSAQSVAGSLGQNNSFLGIYLPLLWNVKCCVKSPLVLGYSCSHFCPLLPTSAGASRGPAAELIVAVPLVLKSMQSLPVKFLLPTEELKVAELLQRYLEMEEITVHDMPVSVALIKMEQLPEAQELLDSYLYEMQRVHRVNELQPKVALPGANMNRNNPQTEGAEPQVSKDEDRLLLVNISTPLSGKKAVKTGENFQVACCIPGCNNKAENGMHPHCYVHRNKRVQDEPLIGPLNENGGSIGEIKRMNSTPSGSTNSFHRSQSSPETRPCMVCGCQFYGPREWGYKCSQHRGTAPKLHPNPNEDASSLVLIRLDSLTEENIQHKNNPEVNDYSPEGFQQSPLQFAQLNSSTFGRHNSPPNDQPPAAQNGSSWHRCRNGVSEHSVCNQSGLAHLGGRCRECYMKAINKQQDMRVTKCVTELCRHPGRPEQHYYCDECYEKNKHMPYMPQALKKKLPAEMTDEEILALLPSTNNNGNFEAREYFRCRKPVCQGVSTEQTLGYCNQHFFELFREGKLSIPTAQEAQDFLNTMQLREVKPASHLSHKCIKPSCSGYQIKEGNGHCFFCKNRNLGPLNAEQLKSGSPPQGSPLRVSLPQKPTQLDDSLPSSYEMVTSQTRLSMPHSSHSSLSSSNDLVQSAAPSSPDTSPTRRCTFEHCENAARKEYNGLCHRCFQTLLEKQVPEARNWPSAEQAPRVNKPTSNYLNSESCQIPTRADVVPVKCRTHMCDLYGTDNQQGYCSKCFQDYNSRAKTLRGMEQKTVPEVLSTLPLDMTPRACIQCKERYGDPALRGYCTQCATDKGLLARGVLDPSKMSNIDQCDSKKD